MKSPDRSLLAFVMSSRVGAAAESFRAMLAAALDRSATGAFFRRWQQTWSGSALLERRAFIGIVLLAASVVHVTLAAVAGRMIGPFWLIIPLVTTGLGMLCVVAGRTRSLRE